MVDLPIPCKGSFKPTYSYCMEDYACISQQHWREREISEC